MLTSIYTPLLVASEAIKLITEIKEVYLLNGNTLFHNQINYEKFKTILQSNAAVSSYMKCIKKRIEKKVNKEEIKLKLINILANIKIYRANLPNTILGSMLHDRSIIINNKFYDANNYYGKLQDIMILTTLLHEISHILIRYYKDLNYFNLTGEFEIKDNGVNFNFKDLGEFLDFLLIQQIDNFFGIDYGFLFSTKNWQDEPSSFKKNFLSNRNNLSQDEKKATGFNLKIEVKNYFK